MSFLDPTKPASWALIDAEALNGRSTVVSCGQFFALARWTGETWIHPGSGIAVGFDPVEYLKRERVGG